MIRLLRNLRKAYDFFTKHWFLSAFLSTIPAYWFIFIKIQGKLLGLVDEAGTLSPFANTIFWVLFPSAIMFSLLKAIGDRQDNLTKENAQILFMRILGKIRHVNLKKFRRYDSFVTENHGKSLKKIFTKIIDPHEQISSLLEELQEFFSFLSDIPRENIAISVVYRFDDDADWKWLHSICMHDDLSLEDVVDNSMTTFRKLIDSGKKVKFYPDKRIAITQKSYVTCKKDQSYGNIGSIYCRDLSIGDHIKYVHAILSINTFGLQLCLDKDEETKKNIDTIIMPIFEECLQYEICLQYMKEILHMKHA